MRRFVVTLPIAAAAFAFAGCVSNHDELAEHTPDATPSDGAGTRPVALPDATPEAAPDVVPPPSTEDAAPPPEEGARSLTFVHGVTDSPWVALCLSIVHDGKTTALSRPYPESGLSYGESVRIADGELADLATDGISARLVLAHSGAAVAGLDCASILDLAKQLADSPPPGTPAEDGSAIMTAPEAGARDASAPDASLSDASTRLDASSAREAGAHDASVPVAAVRVVPLPALPAGALSQARSYVFVTGGCAGGRGVNDPSQESVCGESYTPSTPTLAAYVVAPPFAAPENKVAITVLGGTPAVTQFDLGFVPGNGGDLETVATRVVPGALRPLSGNTASSTAVIGAHAPGSRVQLFAYGSKVPIYDQSWAPTLDAGRVTDLENGKSYTLVVIGPFPGFSKNRWWNEPLVTVVENR